MGSSWQANERMAKQLLIPTSFFLFSSSLLHHSNEDIDALLIYMQSCTGFVITNQQFPIGCCYLKNSLKDVNSLGIFLNNVVGQTYKKTFIGFGNEPTKAGYQLMGLKDSPYNDIPGACWITLDACFQLCDSKGNVRMQFDDLLMNILLNIRYVTASAKFSLI